MRFVKQLLYDLFVHIIQCIYNVQNDNALMRAGRCNIFQSFMRIAAQRSYNNNEFANLPTCNNKNINYENVYMSGQCATNARASLHTHTHTFMCVRVC